MQKTTKKIGAGMGLSIILICALLLSCATAGQKAGGAGTADTNAVPEVSSFYGTKWILVEFVGGTVNGKEGTGNTPFLIFNENEKTFSGNAGINNILGSFELPAETKIKIYPMAQTLMAGPNMAEEEQFKQTLQSMDTYYINGNELSMTKARMAPILKFIDSRAMPETK